MRRRGASNSRFSVWQSTNSLVHKLIKNVLTARRPAAVAYTHLFIYFFCLILAKCQNRKSAGISYVDAENYACYSRTHPL